jgi:hypothetical protein
VLLTPAPLARQSHQPTPSPASRDGYKPAYAALKPSSLVIAFRNSEVFEGEPVSTVLNEAVDLVERIIGIFEKQFFH